MLAALGLNLQPDDFTLPDTAAAMNAFDADEGPLLPKHSVEGAAV